jgi:hypothetical protein
MLHGPPLPTLYYATTVLELMSLDLSKTSVVQYQYWSSAGPCHYSAAHFVTLTTCGVIRALMAVEKTATPHSGLH